MTTNFSHSLQQGLIGGSEKVADRRQIGTAIWMPGSHLVIAAAPQVADKVRANAIDVRIGRTTPGFAGPGETSWIVTDIQMPGLSGLDLQCRLDAAGSAIPMVFITAFPEEHLRTRAEAGGAVGFLAKPFDGQTLAHLLVTANGS